MRVPDCRRTPWRAREYAEPWRTPRLRVPGSRFRYSMRRDSFLDAHFRCTQDPDRTGGPPSLGGATGSGKPRLRGPSRKTIGRISALHLPKLQELTARVARGIPHGDIARSE